MSTVSFPLADDFFCSSISSLAGKKNVKGEFKVKASLQLDFFWKHLCYSHFSVSSADLKQSMCHKEFKQKFFFFEIKGRPVTPQKQTKGNRLSLFFSLCHVGQGKEGAEGGGGIAKTILQAADI